MLKKSILQIYALLCCLLAVIIFMFTITSALDNFTDISFTEAKLGANLIPYGSNEKFLTFKADNREQYSKLAKLSQEALTEYRQQARLDLIRSKQLDAKASLFSTITWLVIGIIIFISHWKLYKRTAQD